MNTDQILTPDSADLQLLSQCHPTAGIIQIPLGSLAPPPMQSALERCIMRGWLRLIDLAYIQKVKPDTLIVGAAKTEQVVTRVFRLTTEGRARLRALRARAS